MYEAVLFFRKLLRACKNGFKGFIEWIRLYKREKYVYDQLIKNVKKYNLNKQEVSTPPFGHAFQYFDGIVLRMEHLNIPIPKK